jgi:molecular chaperone IbpA
MYTTTTRSRNSNFAGAMLPLINQAIARLDETNYPPMNILKVDEDNFMIELALAGFTEDDLSINVESSTLTITANAGDEDEGNAARKYLHRGLAKRAFKRTFQLGQYVEVSGATLSNGLLVVQLERKVPDAMKPRQIQITSQAA